MQLKGTYPVIFVFVLFFLLQAFAAPEEKKSNKKPAVASKDEIEEKEVTFQTTLIDSELVDVLWCGKDRESVVVVTELGNVYHSNTSGMNWYKKKGILLNTAKKHVSDDEDVIFPLLRIMINNASRTFADRDR